MTSSKRIKIIQSGLPMVVHLDVIVQEEQEQVQPQAAQVQEQGQVQIQIEEDQSQLESRIQSGLYQITTGVTRKNAAAIAAAGFLPALSLPHKRKAYGYINNNNNGTALDWRYNYSNKGIDEYNDAGNNYNDIEDDTHVYVHAYAHDDDEEDDDAFLEDMTIRDAASRETPELDSDIMDDDDDEEGEEEDGEVHVDAEQYV
ncbi:hypothetical protein BGZ46_002879 [Entomortierella lignicola]|nr:hypothetical protein BGZ46_002879 [Entomortierella lignicola]